MPTGEQKGNPGLMIAAAGFGAALCVVAGAVLGVLFAPKSGKETRAQLGDWLAERRDEGAELLAQLKEAGLNKKEQVAAAIKAGGQAFSEAGKHG